MNAGVVVSEELFEKKQISRFAGCVRIDRSVDALFAIGSEPIGTRVRGASIAETRASRSATERPESETGRVRVPFESGNVVRARDERSRGRSNPPF
jgi:hypothetical protein